ncbi:TPA: hypothetical protein N0F65_004772 [Lagenidium giganteum]|uniref:CSN8/PSMD8/EIF3K domain-containing protein n=1 Tax=Lagenidium giganteum TaxID=4803 RepID=A0AAV2YTN7_9STRA|nr:TPA: hypothetical protein N0F65_004772 [Lagenidium giganteum]
MENTLEKLQHERAQLQNNVLEIEDNDRKATAQRVQALKECYEELELVAAAVAPPTQPEDGMRNPNPAVLTGEFYASYLVVLLLSKNLNDARFLWKRIAPETKQASAPLKAVWEIGKALWTRNIARAYEMMDQPWPGELQQLIGHLRVSTRASMAELLSVAYSKLSFNDAAQALGFAQQQDLVAYCEDLKWQVHTSEQLLQPEPLAHNPSHSITLQQLDDLAQHVLHLEQNTVMKLP